MKNIPLQLIPLLALLIFFSLLDANQIIANNLPLSFTVHSDSSDTPASRKLFGGEITNMGYGGPAVKFSRFNQQTGFMTGGRGACIINNRFTLGGGGYGIANGIEIPGADSDTTRYFKLGYGGLELGYFFFAREKMHFGCNILMAVGGAFWQGKPKSSNESLPGNDFYFLPVLEPSIYAEVALNRFMWFHAGISYRYIDGSNLTFMKDEDMRGFSLYIAILFGKTY